MKLSDYLSRDEIDFFTRKSDSRGFSVLLGNWIFILAIFTVVYVFPNPLTIILALLMIGGRQLGLAVLMHECGHRTLFKTPELNDVLGQWLCAMPVMSYLPAYAAGHLQHHKFAGTVDDPDLPNYQDYPVDSTSFKRKVFRDISGQTGMKLVKAVFGGAQTAFTSQSSSSGSKKDNPFLQILFVQLMIFILLSVLFAPWVYLIWAGSFLTTFMMIIRLRQVAEHANVPDLFDLDPRKNTRTTIPRPWERIIFTPNWVNYHLEHHFMASVPCYRLKALHQLLKKRGAYEETPIFYGYASVMRHAVKPELG